MTELVPRLNSIDATYHAAVRYEQDYNFQRPCYREHFYPYNPQAVAAQLRENARRMESMHAERNG